ncbi:MAG: hypothetical protein CVV13_02605 [Gammaproteobacteria bacterium HGW-Gammaproteobacteria-3]|nr:MAG: hypothetical protein CVV13_02605 [Gammaproteobacteria bacterium HGW-Gammaproteobacteria-3]
MDIIHYQAALMAGGSETFNALKAGDTEQILRGLTDIAYYALAAIARRGEQVTQHPVSWRHDGFVISLMRLLSDKINQCATGRADHYSDLYCVCSHLASSFLNADFDKAFQTVCRHKSSPLNKQPLDLSDCLFE